MDISKGAVGILAAVCLTVGAAGAYLANRGVAPATSEPSAQSLPISPDPADAGGAGGGAAAGSGGGVPRGAARATRAPRPPAAPPPAPPPPPPPPPAPAATRQ